MQSAGLSSRGNSSKRVASGDRPIKYNVPTTKQAMLSVKHTLPGGPSVITTTLLVDQAITVRRALLMGISATAPHVPIHQNYATSKWAVWNRSVSAQTHLFTTKVYSIAAVNSQRYASAPIR